MADETKKTAQVFRLVKSGGMRNKVLKDLGPTGGNNPNGDAIQGNAFEPEDEYQQLYVGATRDQGIIQPPFNLRHLDRLSQENNTLEPCIEAMITNIDGTGYDFEAEGEDEDDAEDDAHLDDLREFFAQCWPAQSFRETRKLLRRDLERIGNGYLEVLRNAQDEIVFLRHVDGKMMRMLRLDDAVALDQTVVRKGQNVTLKVMTRERRYCQLVNGVSLMYFKEFGSKRDLHKKTAVWAPLGQKLPANMRATEIIHFTAILDSHTPYGVPRWTSQMPSVLGSRKAEEFNLEFFDNGGVPPIMILLQGGTLQAETRQAIEEMTSGAAKDNNRVRVLEVEPTVGTVDSASKATITVERFGGDRTKDSMFEEYDQKCEERVRRAFRLPPIFLGQAQDYNFATAFASYIVAEAQVFKPDRDAFDEIITMKLLPAMGYDGYMLKSKPLVIEDATLKLQGIEAISGLNQVEPADIVDAINQVVGLRLKVSDSAPELKDVLNPPMPPLAPGQPPANSNQNPNARQTMGANGVIVPINPQTPSPTGPGSLGQAPPIPKLAPMKAPFGMAAATKKSDEPITGLQLAHDMMLALRKRDMASLAKGVELFSVLDTASQERVLSAAAELQFIDPSLDLQGLSDLASCTMEVMAEHGHAH